MHEDNLTRERDPKFWSRDAKSTSTSQVKVVTKNSGVTSGRRQEPGIEYLQIPYSKDRDNLFAGDYKTGDVRSQTKYNPKSRQETEFVRQRAVGHNQEGNGRDRDRNRNSPSNNNKGYGNSEQRGHNNRQNRDYYDDGALAIDITGDRQGIDYGSKNKKDLNGHGKGLSIIDSRENNKHARGLSIARAEDERNRDRGRPKNDNTGDKYYKQNVRIGRGKPMANKNRHVTKPQYESKEDSGYGGGKQTESKKYPRPTGRGRDTTGLLNKDENHKPGRGGRNKNVEESPDRGGRPDDIDEKRKPSRGRPIKDTANMPVHSGRIDDIDEKRKQSHVRPVKEKYNGPERSGRIYEKRKPSHDRPIREKDNGPDRGGQIYDMDEKRQPSRGRTTKDTEDRPERGGRLDDIHEKRKPGQNRPIPGVERIRNNRPFAGSHDKGGPGRGGMNSDENRGEPSYDRPVADVDEGRGPSRNKPAHNKGGSGSGHRRPNGKEDGNIRQGNVKKIARDPSYNEEEKGSGGSKHQTTKKRSNSHHDQEATTKAKQGKHAARFTTGIEDDNVARDHESEYEDKEVEAESQEVDKRIPKQGIYKKGKGKKESILRNSKDKKGKSRVSIKPLGPSDLPDLSPHSIARQLICIAKKNNKASIVQENIGRTAEYRDIIMWKMKEKKYFRSGANFRVSGDNKYVDEGPEKKIIFIVHGLSVMGWGQLPCLSETKQFETLLSYYVENLDSFDIFLIPMANPDGVAANKKNGYWNKNMSPQKACPGVALDRNFDVAWNVSRSVSSCNGQFPGPTPFSELETQAIREVFHHYGHKIVGYFHVHSGTFESHSFKGDAVLYPKGYTESQSDDDKYIDLRGEIDEALRNASFKVLSVTVDTLYNWYGMVAGSSVDYASSVYGIPYALELVMQIYENSYTNPPEEREQHLALTEVWQMVLDVIFDHICRKNNGSDNK